METKRPDYKKEEEVKIKISLFCPRCNKQVSGYTAKEVNWNYDVHLKMCICKGGLEKKK